MQERNVSVGSETYKMTDPFFVLATQNPLEQEGTYPLPEAQLDRFLFEVRVGYPNRTEELEIMQRMTAPFEERLQPVLSGEDIINYQALVRRVPVADHLFRYAREIVRATRRGEPEAPDFVANWLAWGGGPRASMVLILAAKARALLSGRVHVTWEDIDAVAKPALRHRIILNFAAKSEEITPDHVIEKVIAHVPKTKEWKD
jgi:MoxR-like ATPase